MKMKKPVIAIISIVLLLLSIFFIIFITPFIGTKKFQTGTEFSGGKIISVKDGMSQLFIVNGGNGEIALIDAGNSADGKPVMETLASKRIKSSDVKAILLTHGHADHTASAKLFPKAKIFSLKEEIGIVEGSETNHSPITRMLPAKTTGLKVSNPLNDGDVVKIGALNIEVFSIPGHTNGSAAYLVEGVLFLGDAALSTSDGKIRQAVWVFSTDVTQQNRSLKNLAGRLKSRKNDVKNIVFSHSGDIEGLKPLIDFTEKIK